MTKRSATKNYSWLITLLTILVVFACALTITGTWFTDTKDITGNLQDPIINIEIVDEDGAKVEDYFYASSTDSKPVYIKFTDTTNVQYQLVRVLVNVEWGTIENNNFKRDDSIPAGLDALTPNYTSTTSWVRGEIADLGNLEYIAQQSGESIESLKSILQYGNTTVEELAASFGVTLSNSPTYYYYNDILDINSLTNDMLQVISGFTFNGESGSVYEGKTAKISITVESASVSDKTIGENGVWIKDEEHVPSNKWLGTINAKRQTLNI